MKKSLLIIAIFGLKFSFAQTKQGSLIDDARYFRRIHDYEKSLSLFKLALKTKCIISDDYYSAIRVAQLNNDINQAFKWLDDFSKIDSYMSTEEIASDSLLLDLHSDKRWDSFISVLKKRNKEREEKYDLKLKKELDQIYFDDQDIRYKYLDARDKLGASSKVLDSMMNIMQIIDSINLIKVSVILEKYGWLNNTQVGEKANSALFGVIQHADLKTQEKYLPILEKAFMEGTLPAFYYAEFIDRVKLRETKRQIYGTQYYWKPNSNEKFVAPLADPDNIDQLRFKIGLGHFAYFMQGQDINWNLEEYKKNLPLYEKWSENNN